MTRKERIARVLQRLPDDTTYEQVIHEMIVLRDIEIGLEQAARGEGTEHEEFMKELLADPCLETKSSGPLKRKKISDKFNGTSHPMPQKGRVHSRTA